MSYYYNEIPLQPTRMPKKFKTYIKYWQGYGETRTPNSAGRNAKWYNHIGK